jgi:hypothetical protein
MMSFLLYPFIIRLPHIVMALCEVIASAVLLRLAAAGLLRSRWWLICSMAVPVLILMTFSGLLLKLQQGRVHGPGLLLLEAIGIGGIAALSITLMLRRQVGGGLSKPLLWLGVLAAALSFIIKVKTGGYLVSFMSLEMSTGVLLATPAVHVLVRMVSSDRAASRPLVGACIAADVILIATALLRLDTWDTPYYFAYRVLFFGWAVRPEVEWIGPVASTYNLALYLPVAASWFVCLWLAWRQQRPTSTVTPSA